MPMEAFKELSDLQDFIDISKVRCFQLSVLYGELEKTVDMPKVLAVLNQHAIPFKTYPFKHSGHNIFHGADKDEVFKQLIDILRR